MNSRGHHCEQVRNLITRGGGSKRIKIMQEIAGLDAHIRREFPNAHWVHIPLGESWLEQFRSIRSSAFRLETLQEYAEPSEREALAAFRRHEEVSGDYIRSWCDMVRMHTSAGKSMARVHLVQMPLSDYLRFEIEAAYTLTAAAGESIQLLDAANVAPELLNCLSSDFWLLDDARVMVQHYNAFGALMNSSLTMDRDTVAHFQKVRDSVVPIATPFAEFYQKHTGCVL